MLAPSRGLGRVIALRACAFAGAFSLLAVLVCAFAAGLSRCAVGACARAAGLAWRADSVSLLPNLYRAMCKRAPSFSERQSRGVAAGFAVSGVPPARVSAGFAAYETPCAAVGVGPFRVWSVSRRLARGLVACAGAPAWGVALGVFLGGATAAAVGRVAFSLGEHFATVGAGPCGVWGACRER
jgi:hypothetical protein